MKRKLVLLASMLALVLAFAGCNSSAETKEAASTEKESIAATTAFTGDYVVNADYVAQNIDKIILVDARGVEAASKQTVKGAVALDWQTISKCADRAAGDEGFSVIMDAPDLAKTLGELGLDPSKEIVLFASAQEGWGEDGRIAWELIAAGYSKVKIVNGGLAALKDAGLETQAGGSTLDSVEVTISKLNEDHMINTDELKKDYDQYKIVDVRADSEYDGATDYGELKGGHLPGAIHIRFTDLFNEDQTLKSNEEITAMFTDAGLSPDDKIVTYCTAGIRSAYMQLIMEQCGFKNVKNYDESYYRWCAVNDVE